MSRRRAAVVLLVAMVSAPGCGTSPAPEPSSPTQVAADLAQTTARAPGAVRATSLDGPVTITVQGSGVDQSRTIVPTDGVVFTRFELIAGAYTLTVTQEETQLPPGVQHPIVLDGVTDIYTFFDDSGLRVDVEIVGVPFVPSPPPPGCIIDDAVAGAPLSLEGDVVTGSSEGFSLRANRARGPVEVDATDAGYVCLVQVGQCPPPGSLARVKVHLKGLLESCTGISARVVATEVKIKKLP